MNTFMAKQFDRSAQSPDTSNSSANTPKASSTNESESSGGFKSFWRTTDKSSQPQNLTFVQQDPSSKKSMTSPTLDSWLGGTNGRVRTKPYQSTAETGQDDLVARRW